jgi:deoxyribonuclease V
LQVTNLALDLPDLPQLLAELLEQVPLGRMTTYGALAEALGSEAAARWVGHWMMHHEHGPGCVCHRVVRADGSPGKYIGGEPSDKATLLDGEGVTMEENRVAAIGQEAFREFRTTRPLAALRTMQDEICTRVSLRGRRTMPATVAGVDVSYSGNRGTGAYVLWDLKREERIWSTTVTQEVTFPYITGYLAFRELPILLALMEAARAARRQGDVVIVDGSGVLHPRGVGIACHLGVLTGVPTIGVSKKLLCGQVNLKGMAPEEGRPVLMAGRSRGTALRATGGSRRPIFISPGHRIGVGMSESIVRRQLLGRRLPEVQYWADRLSRSASQSDTSERHVPPLR